MKLRGDSLADRPFSKQAPSSSTSNLPFPLFHRGHREAFTHVSETCTANGPLSGASIARSLGHSKKSMQNYTPTSEGEASLYLHRRLGPQCRSAAVQFCSQFSLSRQVLKGKTERETTSAPTKVRRKDRRNGEKKKDCRGAPHLSCGETVKNRGLLPNKWRL